MQNAETEIPQKIWIIQDYTLNISCYIIYILMRIYNLEQNKNSNFYWNFKLHVKLFCYLSFIWPFWGICPNLFKKLYTKIMNPLNYLIPFSHKNKYLQCLEQYLAKIESKLWKYYRIFPILSIVRIRTLRSRHFFLLKRKGGKTNK